MLLSSCYTLKLTSAKLLQILLTFVQTKHRKRKRSEESKDPPIRALAKPLQKRSRTSVADTIGWEAASADTKSEINLIMYWIQKES